MIYAALLQGRRVDDAIPNNGIMDVTFQSGPSPPRAVNRSSCARIV